MNSNTLSVDVATARRFIESHLDKRQVNKIQHSFPSPRYWSESNVPVEETLDDRRKLHAMVAGTEIVRSELDRAEPDSPRTGDNHG